MSTRTDRRVQNAPPPAPPSMEVLAGAQRAVFVERPNKYLALVDLEGVRTEAFVPNPGRMKELMVPGREVLLRPASGASERRTRFDLVAVRLERRLVLIDSGIPNRYLKLLLQAQALPELSGWNLLKAEVFGRGEMLHLCCGRRRAISGRPYGERDSTCSRVD